MTNKPFDILALSNGNLNITINNRNFCTKSSVSVSNSIPPRVKLVQEMNIYIDSVRSLAVSSANKQRQVTKTWLQKPRRRNIR